VVISDDSDDGNSPKGSPSRGNRHVRQKDDSEQDENQSDDPNNMDDEVDGDVSDNLTGLNQVELKQRFTTEVFQKFLPFNYLLKLKHF
jgi:hypothetical protein